MFHSGFFQYQHCNKKQNVW